MVRTPANVVRYFLPWDRPLLPQAAAWLAGNWAGGAPLDLASTLVIVPTQQSARRLREALAEHAARRGQATFPPRVLTPESLVAHALTGSGVAGRTETLLAWATVLSAVELEEFRAVFPVDPPVRNAAWALRLAQQLTQLQAALLEVGLRLADVAARAGTEFAETERWTQLGELEARCDRELAAHDLRAMPAATIAAVRAGQLNAAGPVPERVVLLATPDPLPLALELLAAHAAEQPVEVVVFAPAEAAEDFDGWGRPRPEHWAHRELALADFERRVQLEADPAAQAERIVALARDYAEPDGLLALGAADAEVIPLLEAGLARAGVAAFNPGGRPRRATALYQLLAALAGLVREPSFAAVEALARCPDFLEFLAAQLGANFSAARFLAELDDLRTRHLPADLAAAQRSSPHPAFDRIAELRATLTRGEFPGNAAAALGAIFAGRQLDPASAAAAQLQYAAEAWTEVLRECAATGARWPGLNHGEWWDLALRLFGDSHHAEEKPAGALELQGWLELLFEDAPHLVVAGLNDGCVPEAVVGDAFLPEALRGTLGLKTNPARFARDAYVLQALAACRNEAGRLDLLFGKTSAGGEPLRPSRLLLQCPDEALPARIARLFREPALAPPNPPWMRSWRLVPRVVSPPPHVAVTAFRAWLACPFRFYLRYGLRLAAVDPAKNELDATDFGTLCHAALEAMGREPALRDCTEAERLREFLHAELARVVRRRYGDNLTLPLVIQLESARQRLGQAAEVQARERAAGWVILEVERPFELEVGGLVVRGKIDRIDRHESTGAVRVLDYKTSDKPVNPADAHLRPARRDEEPDAWRVVEVEGKPRIWTDLQLPFYERKLAAEFGGNVACGYFNLPKAVGETDRALWDAFTPELRASAWACAEQVSVAIRAGVFWPPAEDIKEQYDEFATLFQRGAAASVAWPGAADPAEEGAGTP